MNAEYQQQQVNNRHFEGDTKSDVSNESIVKRERMLKEGGARDVHIFEAGGQSRLKSVVTCHQVHARGICARICTCLACERKSSRCRGL